jgi:retron-type reverse transcriptase
LYASIIQKRLATYIDPMISRTQFGFRQSRSTTHALYVARRLQDISEQSGDTAILTLLDWEKAFDRVAHPRMIEALERMNIP